MKPAASPQGPISPQAKTAPSSSDTPARKPMIAPKPSNSMDGSKEKVRFFALTPP
jgi:hypothetical protein